MTLDATSARIIGKEMGKAMLQAQAPMMRLDVAESLYGPSKSFLLEAANHGKGKFRLRVKRRVTEKGNGKIVLVERKEMERWIQDNFEEAPKQKTPTDESAEV